jgi:hypothetical protein
MGKGRNSSDVGRGKRPRVFIGSSSEGLAVARALQPGLYYEAEPVKWSRGVFGLSGGTLESLVAECDNFDFAVFVQWHKVSRSIGTKAKKYLKQYPMESGWQQIPRCARNDKPGFIRVDPRESVAKKFPALAQSPPRVSRHTLP